MNTVVVQQADKLLDFISSVKLNVSDQSYNRIDLEDSQVLKNAASYVNKGSIFYFDDSISSELRTTILHIELIAQLSADSVLGAASDVDLWYTHYIGTLRNLGVDIDSPHFSKTMISGDAFTMDQLIWPVLNHMMTADELNMLCQSVSRLNRLYEANQAQRIFSQNAHAIYDANFRLISVQNLGDQLLMKQGIFKLNSKRPILRLMRQLLITNQSDLQHSLIKGSLDTSLLKEIHTPLAEKVSGMDNQFIDGLITTV